MLTSQSQCVVTATRDLYNLLIHQVLHQRRYLLSLAVHAYPQLARVILTPGVQLPIGYGDRVVVAASYLSALQVGDLLGRAQEVLTDNETQLATVVAPETEHFRGGGGED